MTGTANSTPPAPAEQPAAGRATLSPTSGLNQRVRELAAQGRPLTVLTAGETGWPPPRHVREAAAEAALAPTGHGYGPVAGTPALREAVAADRARRTGSVTDPAHVVVTHGAKHALTVALLALLAPGDRVLVPTPTWPSYAEAVRLAGGRPVSVPIGRAARFAVGVEQLERAAGGARVLVLCSPANPTGTVLGPDELDGIGGWCARHGVTVLLDQVYDRLAWVPVGDQAGVLRSAGARVVVVDSVSKSYGMTGWRVGWLVGDRQLARDATAVLSHTANHVGPVPQAAATAALTGDQSVVRQLREHLAANRDRVTAAVAAAPGAAELDPPDGTFFAFPSFRPLVDSGRYDSGTAVADALLEHLDIAVLPGAAFGAPDHARLSFAGDGRQVADAVTRALAFLLATPGGRSR